MLSGHHAGELWQEEHHVGDVCDHGEHDQHYDDRPPDLPNDILERRAGYARGDEQAHAERRGGQADHHVEADDDRMDHAYDSSNDLCRNGSVRFYELCCCVYSGNEEDS